MSESLGTIWLVQLCTLHQRQTEREVWVRTRQGWSISHTNRGHSSTNSTELTLPAPCSQPKFSIIINQFLNRSGGWGMVLLVYFSRRTILDFVCLFVCVFGLWLNWYYDPFSILYMHFCQLSFHCHTIRLPQLKTRHTVQGHFLKLKCTWMLTISKCQSEK